MAEPWERLSFFESRDILTRAYHKRHGRNLLADKARDIVSHLIQGREFYASARQAADLVRPLLLYYGVLALSRALILFLDTGKSSESALSDKHGCSVHDWEHDLVPGIQALPALKIRFQQGTFSELMTATHNEETVHLTGPFESAFRPYLVRQPGALALPSGTIVTLREVFARIPNLQTLYERTLGERSACFGSWIEVESENTQTNILLYKPRFGLPNEQEIRDSLGLPQDLGFIVNDDINEAISGLRFSLEHGSIADLVQHLPPVKHDLSKDSRVLGRIPAFLVSPLPGGMNLSSLSLLYLVAYASGMLVRYYPSIWRSLINRDRGDYAFPLLQSAITVVEEHFPELLLMDLETMSVGDKVEWLV